ncbi:MAG: DUF1573 domain-containing protein [Acidobacteria bacterium]|nr:DUF1573 domain-containing protein [Acidobacteriota bacterium]
MRRNRFVQAATLTAVCLFALAVSLAHSQSQEQVLKATPVEFDFGTVAEGKPAVATTTIENIGSEPVEITSLRTN